jgi:hypothetical protein
MYIVQRGINNCSEFDNSLSLNVFCIFTYTAYATVGGKKYENAGDEKERE